jgi:aldose sugar dehydrogenase
MMRMSWLLRSSLPALVLGLACAAAAPQPSVAQEVSVEVVATDLATVWAIDFAPDGRIFLTERSGRVRTLRDGRVDPEPWITLEVVEVAESGLLGLALDPGFATNGYVYVAFTYATGDGGMQNRLVRLREDPATGRGVFDAVLLDDVRGGRVHDGGRVEFGPDGKLYWTMGETGSPDLAQSLDSWNGKVLRINSDGSIPDDNPFPGSPIYSYGHRNPQGLAWQPGTGRLYATEHGPSGQQACCDEVNHVQPAMNYGWPQVFGGQTAPGTVPPILESGPSRETIWAPGGAAFVTSGPWAGSLIFVGLRGESLYRVALDPADPTGVFGFETLFKGEYSRLREVVEGPDGALYVGTSNRDGRGSPQPGDDRPAPHHRTVNGSMSGGNGVRAVQSLGTCSLASRTSSLRTLLTDAESGNTLARSGSRKTTFVPAS